MNDILTTINQHRSIRKFLDKEVGDDNIAAIVQAAQAAPSSINGQQVSIIMIKDKERLAKMSKLGQWQSFIKESPLFLLFCVDFRRAQIACEMNGQSMKVQGSLDSVVLGAVDVGLYAGFANIAAESLGLGTVIIGGLREFIDEVADFVEIPELVVPVIGMAIGYPAENPEVKPRLPMEAVVFNEKYNDTRHRELIDKYDQTFLDYSGGRTGGNAHNWSSGITSRYKNKYNLNVSAFLKKQGFGLE